MDGIFLACTEAKDDEVVPWPDASRRGCQDLPLEVTCIWLTTVIDENAISVYSYWTHCSRILLIDADDCSPNTVTRETLTECVHATLARLY